MVEFGNVSKVVRKLVANIAQLEGNKKKIDTQFEYNTLGEYLNGHASELSVEDKDFIEGFMIEYEQKTENGTVIRHSEESNKIVYLTQIGDTWIGIVEKFYPDLLDNHNPGEAITLLKKALTKNPDGTDNQEAYLKLRHSTDISRTLHLPEYIDGCRRYDAGKDANATIEKGARTVDGKEKGSTGEVATGHTK